MLLLPLISYSQRDTVIVYKTKEVHSIAWKSNDSTLSWKIDTIRYRVPFEIKITKKNIAIDGYGPFKIDSIRRHEGSAYINYRLPKGIGFTWIERYAYLEYPISKKKSKVIVFYISGD